MGGTPYDEWPRRFDLRTFWGERPSPWIGSELGMWIDDDGVAELLDARGIGDCACGSLGWMTHGDPAADRVLRHVSWAQVNPYSSHDIHANMGRIDHGGITERTDYHVPLLVGAWLMRDGLGRFVRQHLYFWLPSVNVWMDWYQAHVAEQSIKLLGVKEPA